MNDIITTLLEAFYNAVISFVQWLFNTVFGSWNYGILFSWLPSDIQSAVTFIILFLFGLAVLQLLKHLTP